MTRTCGTFQEEAKRKRAAKAQASLALTARKQAESARAAVPRPKPYSSRQTLVGVVSTAPADSDAADLEVDETHGWEPPEVPDATLSGKRVINGWEDSPAASESTIVGSRRSSESRGSRSFTNGWEPPGEVQGVTVMDGSGDLRAAHDVNGVKVHAVNGAANGWEPPSEGLAVTPVTARDVAGVTPRDVHGVTARDVDGVMDGWEPAGEVSGVDGTDKRWAREAGEPSGKKDADEGRGQAVRRGPGDGVEIVNWWREKDEGLGVLGEALPVNGWPRVAQIGKMRGRPRG
jgi:hypothetical protein